MAKVSSDVGLYISELPFQIFCTQIVAFELDFDNLFRVIYQSAMFSEEEEIYYIRRYLIRRENERVTVINI